MRITRLGTALGAEVTGIDLSGPLGDQLVTALKEAWRENQVLVIRDQQLSAESQAAFAKCFGELERVRTTPDSPDREQTAMYVSNREVEGSKGVLPTGEMLFHSDQCYYDVPCKATLLHSLQLPARGGDTLFSSAYRAYEALPVETRERVRGLWAENVYDYRSSATKRTAVPSDDAPRAVHPVVIEHPETHRPVLYVNPLMTHRIIGVEADESTALLEELFRVIEDPSFVYRHAWRHGDLVMWDNRCVLHARTDFDPAEARVLRRYTVRGDGAPRAFEEVAPGPSARV
jgi:taurine dioxygenase